MRVYAALPSSPTVEKDGIGDDDLNMEGNEFCWNIESTPDPIPPQSRNDPLVLEHAQSGRRFLDKLLHHNFKTHHDIALGFSDTKGPIVYTLWASGRVTETRTPLESDDPANDAREKEIVPPYDFIR